MKVLDQLVFLGRDQERSGGGCARAGKKWLERLDLGGWADKTVESLSKGMQQKVQFIATVLHEPKLILLDEPFTGLNPINTEIFKEIIEELQQDGRAVVLSTHVMEQVEKLCKRICLINKGKKILSSRVRSPTSRCSSAGTSSRSGSRGTPRYLERHRGVEHVGTFGQELTVTLAAGTDTNLFLRHALEGGKVEKFEIGEMSLHDIFIAKVKSEGGEVNDEASQGR